MRHIVACAVLLSALSATATSCKETCQSFESWPQTDRSADGLRFSEVSIEIDKQCRQYRVYLFTYATDTSSRGFCVTAASAVANGFRLNVLGVGQQISMENMYMSKMWTLKEVVDALLREIDKELQKRTLIFFIDAYDVLVSGTPSALVTKTLLSRKKILFSGEKGCCPRVENLMYHKNYACDVDWLWPETTTSLPFLNSGMFVGFVTQVAIMLQEAKEEYDSRISKIEDKIQPLNSAKGPWNPYLLGTDQLLYCYMLSHHNMPSGKPLRKALKMGIDYHADILVSMYDMPLTVIRFTKNGRVKLYGSDFPCYVNHQFFEVCQNWTRNNPKPTFPVAVHFNGRGIWKENMMKVAARMTWPFVSDAEFWNKTMYHIRNHTSAVEVPLGETCKPLMPPHTRLWESV